MNSIPVTRYLRLEGGLALGLSILTYTHLSGPGWPWLLVLVPDLSFVAYRAGPRIGALAYNLCHSYLLPALLGVLGMLLNIPALEFAALIWTAHIGWDRLLGYGLKHPTSFHDTHLGRLGRAQAARTGAVNA
ncbi:DUF4260 domain-containing protein [Deinococcus sp. KNUC1210]|uniref:DUF4260 domain-containing protein n=1 Tax=Deinococcus sp. KNUC1210 TaxID=2917691 RepID=UPI001EF1236A|nr:DUF4260 domain-containing protein [Deinococcus sp. KNUC1210]ULH16424.1 DUF4260 domain-containing protein [Deinococcus sp. KNUC1210]